MFENTQMCRKLGKRICKKSGKQLDKKHEGKVQEIKQNVCKKHSYKLLKKLCKILGKEQ